MISRIKRVLFLGVVAAFSYIVAALCSVVTLLPIVLLMSTLDACGD